MTPLDRDINDSVALLGLLVVFVVGYFSAVVPAADETWGRPTPDVAYDRGLLANRLRAQRNLLAGLIALIAVVLVVIGPLTVRVARALLRGPYSTTRAGVLLVGVLLAAMLVAAAVVMGRVERRRRALLAS